MSSWGKQGSQEHGRQEATVKRALLGEHRRIVRDHEEETPDNSKDKASGSWVQHNRSDFKNEVPVIPDDA